MNGGMILGGVVASIMATISPGFSQISEVTDLRWAFQNPCAERGDTLRHRNVLNPLDGHKIVCSHPSSSQWPGLKSAVSLESMTLCNWNVFGLTVQQSGQRQRHIADYIAYGCDIFAGQEHWFLLDRIRFRRQARHHVPWWNFHYFRHPLLFHPGGGIMIGSIWPILKTDYSPWPGGVAGNAGYKGVGYAQIKTPRGLLEIYNLHLAAGRNRALKEKQLEHLTRFVAQTRDPSLPFLITGDFNFNQNWRISSKKLKALDWLQQKLGVRAVGFKSRIEHTLISDQLEYLDHRVLADWAQGEVYLSKPFIREYSDHPGIITKFQFVSE